MSLFRRRKAAPAPDVAYPSTSVLPAGLPTATPAAAARQPRLLVCDDNNTVTQMLELLFGREGWAVTAVGSGEEGLALLTRQMPDVVLLDQQMDGGLTGLETAKALRKRGYERPVLLFSAFLDDRTRAQAERLDLLPVSKVDFPAVVRHVTAAHATYRRTARQRVRADR